jgi:phage terminase small subunit
MAVRGRKPKPAFLKIVTGNPGHRPTPVHLSELPEIDAAKPTKPPKLRGRALELWDQVVTNAPWLTLADSFKLHVWCELQAEFERAPRKMVASRLAQLRASGSELGLDPASRDRIGKASDAKSKDPADKYF